jgi:DNA-binding transcriptional regulator PaaX
LRDLVVGELLRQGRLLSSREVALVLRRAHPNRRIKEPALRRALEALVEQSKVQRGRRGSRVFYFVTDAAAREDMAV